MNEKQVKEIKDAKLKVVEGSLTLWNARFDALKEAGYTVDLINHIALTDICGCGEGSPVCICTCPPEKKCSDQPAARLPSVALAHDTALCLYDLSRGGGLPVTHAYFPTATFDQYAIAGRWAFSRAGSGYVALAADGELRLTSSGPHAGQELRSAGGGWAWICRVGCGSIDGEFASFCRRLRQAVPRTDGPRIAWTTPGGHVLTCRWGEPLQVNGTPQDRRAPALREPVHAHTFSGPTGWSFAMVRTRWSWICGPVAACRRPRCPHPLPAGCDRREPQGGSHVRVGRLRRRHRPGPASRAGCHPGAGPPLARSAVRGARISRTSRKRRRSWRCAGRSRDVACGYAVPLRPLFKCYLGKRGTAAAETHHAAPRDEAAEMDVLRKAIRMARALDATLIRCFSFWRIEGDPAAFWPALRQRFLEAIALARQEGMILVMENDYECNLRTGAEAARLLGKRPRPICGSSGTRETPTSRGRSPSPMATSR